MEALPILLCVAGVSPFATYPITFLCGEEFARFFTWYFLVEFGAMEPKKVKVNFFPLSSFFLSNFGGNEKVCNTRNPAHL